jgi:hypothetical protein
VCISSLFVRASRSTTAVESFNGRLRDECLKQVFFTVPDARDKLERRRLDYNQVRRTVRWAILRARSFAERRWHATAIATTCVGKFAIGSQLSYLRFRTTGIPALTDHTKSIPQRPVVLVSRSGSDSTTFWRSLSGCEPVAT